MSRTESSWSAIALSACVLLATSCESTTRVGSECPNGVCPRADSVTSRNCEVSSIAIEISVRRADNADLTNATTSLCLARALPTDSSGRVACRVLWLLNEGATDNADEPLAPSPEHCSDLPFLEPAGEAYPDNACIEHQLSPDEIAAGADGWFYDSSDSDCSDQRPGVHFTDAGVPWSRVKVQVDCHRTQAIDGEQLVDVDAGECEPSDDAMSDVGAACLPSVIPGSGFDPRETWVETRSEQCGGGPCLVYRLDGDPSPDCVSSRTHPCPSSKEVARSAYCSCRCAAPEDDPGPLCDCGDGFTCTEALSDGPPGVRGSYCVKDESLSH